MITDHWRFILSLLACFLFCACTPLVNPTPSNTPIPPTSLPPTPLFSASNQMSIGYTHQQPDGNRYLLGRGDVPNLLPLTLPLPGKPIWVVGAPYLDGVLWVALVEGGQEGRYQAFAYYVLHQEVSPLKIRPEEVNPAPPLLEVRGEQARLLVAPTSRHGQTHPVILDQEEGIWAFTYVDRGLLILQQREPIIPEPFDIVPLPDARLLSDEKGRLLLLTDPTEHSPDSVWGDGLAASSLTLVETRPTPQIAHTIPISTPQLIEGVMPLWTDWNGDGEREIVVTLSEAEKGWQMAIYAESGTQLATSQVTEGTDTGQQALAVAPFGVDGSLELAVMQVSSTAGMILFYQWQEQVLQPVATISDYGFHILHSNNGDMGIAGDFDGNGQVELVVPAFDRLFLAGIQRTTTGADVVWRVPTEGIISSNLAAVRLPNGQLGLAVGRADNSLRIWQP